MATDLSEFRKIVRKEIKRAQEQQAEIPTWGDIKRVIDEINLFDTSQMKDKQFRSELKDIATQIAQELTLEAEKEEQAAEQVDKKSTKANRGKKRKSGHSSEDENPVVKPAKKVKRDEVIPKARSSLPEEKPVKAKPKPRKSKAVASDSDEDADIGAKMQKLKTSDTEDIVEDEKMTLAAEKSTLAEAAELSDSALSVLDDTSPKKKKPTTKEKIPTEKGKSKKEKPVKAAGKSKDTAADESIEAQIKRLKGFVVACGVRKKWAKEFEGIEENPNKQIKHLKAILQDLGMTGRLSMEKAKAIRAKRELAEEIEEVVAFEKKRGAAPSEKTKRPTTSKLEISEDEEELASRPPQRRKNVLAFLDDQSDEE